MLTKSTPPVATILLFKCAASLNPNPYYNSFPHHTPVDACSSSASASTLRLLLLLCVRLDVVSTTSTPVPHRPLLLCVRHDAALPASTSVPRRPSRSTPPTHPPSRSTPPVRPPLRFMLRARSSSLCTSTAVEVLPHCRRCPPLPPNCCL
jgi:hypothetical protein